MPNKNNDTTDSKPNNTARKLYDESVTKASDEADNLDTIREILFGEQSREAEKRRHDTHHALQSSISDLKKESNEQFDFLSAEINKLYNLINDETEARQKHSLETKEIAGTLKSSIEQVSARHLADSTKLQQQLINESNKLEVQAAKRHEDLSKRLEEASLELKSDKTDRGDLAKLLQGMAEQLLDSTKKP